MMLLITSPSGCRSRASYRRNVIWSPDCCRSGFYGQSGREPGRWLAPPGWADTHKGTETELVSSSAAAAETIVPLHFSPFLPPPQAEAGTISRRPWHWDKALAAGRKERCQMVGRPVGPKSAPRLFPLLTFAARCYPCFPLFQKTIPGSLPGRLCWKKKAERGRGLWKVTLSGSKVKHGGDDHVPFCLRPHPSNYNGPETIGITSFLMLCGNVMLVRVQRPRMTSLRVSAYDWLFHWRALVSNVMKLDRTPVDTTIKYPRFLTPKII